VQGAECRVSDAAGRPAASPTQHAARCTLHGLQLSLASSTGHPQIDEIIRGLIGIFEIAFPGRIRGCYLVGSYADGSAVALSDIDLRVVFKEGFADSAEEERVRQVRGYCRQISPVSIAPSSVGRTKHEARSAKHEAGMPATRQAVGPPSRFVLRASRFVLARSDP
jgi:Nucleotidyltransferase domain